MPAPSKRSRKGPSIAEAIREKALEYPYTDESHPWGESAFKVRKKTFIFMNEGDDRLTVTLKLPDSRDFALDLPGSKPTGYGLGSKGWVTLEPSSKTPMGVLFALIEESYRAIAPKRVVKELDARR